MSASPIRLRRLRGFPEAIAELAGVSGRIAGQVALRDACRRVAEVHPRPDGVIRLAAVIEKRRTVGHRVVDAGSALRIAHAVTQGRTMEVRLDGPLVPKLAKTCGLRDARPRPWAKDPQLAEQLAAIADKFLKAWTPMPLEGRPEDGWFCALVAPRVMESEFGPPRSEDNGVAADVILVMNKDGRDARILALSLGQCPMDGTRTEDGVRAAINAMVDHSSPICSGPDKIWQPKEVRIWQPWSDVSFYSAAMQVGIALPPFDGSHNFRKRLEMCWSKVRATALARFRRMLPREIQEHASLCLHQFADARTAGEFLIARRSWTLEDYSRVNQAIRAAPILRSAIDDIDTLLAITEGRPLKEVIKTAMETERNGKTQQLPHFKTVKSLRGTWHHTFRKDRSITSLVRVLDALYRRNPHQPVLKSGEMIQVVEITRTFQAWSDLTVAAILAHRDAKGRIRWCKDLRDVYHWVLAKCHMILLAQSGVSTWSEEDHRPVVEATFGILFPPARTLAGLDALVKEWHADQQRLDAAFDGLFKSMLATKLNQESPDVSAILFPHFMDGEQIIDGVTMRPLTDPQQIVAEGDEMGHCVGSYVGAASGGRSLLISQKSKEGRSTVEVSVEMNEDDEPTLVVQQNRSFGNVDPPLLHRRAITKLLKSFPEAFRRDLAERIRIASALEDRRSGQAYSALDPDDLLRLKRLAFDSMRRFMPRSMRKMSMEEWISIVMRPKSESEIQEAA